MRAELGVEQRRALLGPERPGAVELDRNRILIDKLQDVRTSAAGSGVTFVPSVYGHPHLTVVFSPGWHPVVQYPLGGDGPPAPPEVVAHHSGPGRPLPSQ